LSHLLSKNHISQFLHQIFNMSALSCCWTTHRSRRRHWPMARSTKRCGTFPHSATMAFFSWLTVVNRQHC